MKEKFVNNNSINSYTYNSRNNVIKKKNFSFIIYIFCLVFAPPIFPNINFLVFITVFSLYKLIRKYHKDVKEVFSKSGLKRFFKLFFFASYYIIFIMLINIIVSNEFYLTNYLITIYRFFGLIPMQMICVLYIICRTKRYRISSKELLLYFVCAGIIQSFIGVIALLIPSVKSFLVNLMSVNTGNNVFFDISAYSSGDTYRYYGFAASLLDTFGYGTGIIVSISIFVSFYYSTKYLWLIPLTIVAPLLNSRTGIIIMLMGLFFSLPLILTKIKFRKFLNISLFILIMFFLLLGFYKVLLIYSPTTIIWITRGVDSIFSFIRGRESQYYEVSNVLFSNNFWTFPNGIKLIFGSGHTAYGLTSVLGFHSDVGYVNHIWLGGIVGTILLYRPFIWLFIESFSKSYLEIDKLLVIFLATSFFVMMIKGDLISYSSGVIIMFTICFYFIYKENIN